MTHVKPIVAICLAACLGMMAATAKAATQLSGTLNINTATVEQFTMLPGIGAAKATAIVTLRDAQPKKQFASVAELATVKGIGPKLLKNIEPYVRINGTTTLTATKVTQRLQETGSPNS